MTRLLAGSACSSPAAPAASGVRSPRDGARGMPGRGRRPSAEGLRSRRWRRCRSAGGDGVRRPGRCRRRGERSSSFSTSSQTLRRPRVLVNNAGILIDKPLLETTTADFDRLIGVNLRGAFLVGREALRMMTAQGTGRVINVASELAYVGRANCSLYCASKGGVLSMTRAWAREFAPANSRQRPSPRPDGHPPPRPGVDDAGDARQGSRQPAGADRSPRRDRCRRRLPRRRGGTFMTGQCISPNGGAAMF